MSANEASQFSFTRKRPREGGGAAAEGAEVPGEGGESPAREPQPQKYGAREGQSPRGTYFQQKDDKLHKQLAEARQLAQDERSDLFRNVSVWINGYTQPPPLELRRLIAVHGGNHEQYLVKGRVTHVIATNLPDGKFDQFRGLTVVTPDWIVDSVRAGRLQPAAPYLLSNLRDTRQPGLPFAPAAAAGNSRAARPLAYGDPPAGRLALPPPEAPQPPTSSAAPVAVAVPAAPASTSPPSSRAVRSAQAAPSAMPPPPAPRPPAEAAPVLSSSSRPVRTAQADPNFLRTFYQSSRLHHIGSWRARYQTLVKRLEAEAAALGEPPALAAAAAAAREDGAAAGGRLIVHVDMDCFFASVALRDRPDLVPLPVAVAHGAGGEGSTGEVSSANYVARKFGIHAGMFLGEARRLCPNLVTVPYDFEKYQEVSDAVYAIFFRYSRRVQAVSCDEAYLEFAGLSPARAAPLVAALRKDIFDATRCTASAGIGSSLLLARLATKRAKPDGQLHLPDDEAAAFLADLPVSELPSVGWKLTHRLEEAGITRCGQARALLASSSSLLRAASPCSLALLLSRSLAPSPLRRDVPPQLQSIPRAALEAQFGPKTGGTLWEFARGIDRRAVETRTERKSLGAEVNWGVRFEDGARAEAFLRELCDEVAGRCREAGVRGRTFTLKVKRRAAAAPAEPAKLLGHGLCDSLSRSATMLRATDEAESIWREIRGLYRELAVPPADLRGLGIQVTRLEGASGRKAEGGPTIAALLGKQAAEGGTGGSKAERGQPEVILLDDDEEEEAGEEDGEEEWERQQPAPTAETRAPPPVPSPVPPHPSDPLLAAAAEALGGAVPPYSQVDPRALAALPPNVRAALEVHFARERAGRPAPPAAPPPSAAPSARAKGKAPVRAPPAPAEEEIPPGVDPEFLAALPPDIRREVLAQARREHAAQAPSAPPPPPPPLAPPPPRPPPPPPAPAPHPAPEDPAALVQRVAALAGRGGDLEAACALLRALRRRGAPAFAAALAAAQAAAVAAHGAPLALAFLGRAPPAL